MGNIKIVRGVFDTKLELDFGLIPSLFCLCSAA